MSIIMHTLKFGSQQMFLRPLTPYDEQVTMQVSNAESIDLYWYITEMQNEHSGDKC